MRNSAARLSLFVVPAVFLGALAACGGDDDDDVTGQPEADASADVRGHDATGANDANHGGDGTTGNDANQAPDTSTGDDDSSTPPHDSAAPDAIADAGNPFDGAVKLVVVRVGDGTSALTNAATAVFLDEYALGANAGPLHTAAMPVAASGANAPFTLSGTATSEGQLTRSTDGHSLVLAGFAAAPGLPGVAKTSSIPTPDAGPIDAGGGTDAASDATVADAGDQDATVEDAGDQDAGERDAGDQDAGDGDGGDQDAGLDGSAFDPELGESFDPFAGDGGDAGPAPIVPRVVAWVNASGVDTTTQIAAFSGSDVRSAATVDGTAFWIGGTGTRAGVQYATRGLVGASTTIASPPSNVRSVEIFGAQLFASSASSPFVGIASVGTGLPTSSTTAKLLFPPPVPADAGEAGSPTPLSPFAFVAFDLDANVAGIDRIYAADDPTTGTGGIQKWTFDGTAWTRAAVFNDGVTSSQGLFGLTGFADGSTVTLIATTTDAVSRLVAYVDDGLAASPKMTVLAEAPGNTAFRGVAIAPAP